MTYVNILRGGRIKSGDTEPALRMQCFTEGNDPYNLTGFTGDILLRRSDSDTNAVTGSVSVEQPSVGVIEYDWQSGDTDESGTFIGEVVMEDGSGSIVTFPNEKYFKVYIEEGL